MCVTIGIANVGGRKQIKRSASSRHLSHFISVGTYLEQEAAFGQDDADETMLLSLASSDESGSRR